jgi:hypothetical protein
MSMFFVLIFVRELKINLKQDSYFYFKYNS